jgi:hypothetical protein
VGRHQVRRNLPINGARLAPARLQSSAKIPSASVGLPHHALSRGEVTALASLPQPMLLVHIPPRYGAGFRRFQRSCPGDSF